MSSILSFFGAKMAATPPPKNTMCFTLPAGLVYFNIAELYEMQLQSAEAAFRQPPCDSASRTGWFILI